MSGVLKSRRSGARVPILGAVSRSAPALTVRTVGDRCVVEASGDLDVAASAGLRRTLHDLVVDGRVHLVLDLRGVGFVDSSGLGVLVAAQRGARRLRGSLVLVVDEGPVTRVLGLTGLDRVLRTAATLEEAVGA